MTIVIEEHLDLVDKVVRTRFFANNESLRDDLIQIGRVALVKAARRYQPGRASFASYAYYCIVGGIRNHFRDNVYGPHAGSDKRRGNQKQLFDNFSTKNIVDTERLVGLLQEKILLKIEDKRKAQIAVDRFISGMGYEDIGIKHGICKSRVDQIINRYDIKPMIKDMIKELIDSLGY